MKVQGVSGILGNLEKKDIDQCTRYNCCLGGGSIDIISVGDVLIIIVEICKTFYIGNCLVYEREIQQ